MIADPKALQYVLQTSGYRFPKPRDVRAAIRMILGEGIVYVHGEPTFACLKACHRLLT